MLEKAGEDVQTKALEVKVYIFNAGHPALTHQRLDGSLHGKVSLEQRPGGCGGSEEGNTSLEEIEGKGQSGSVDHAGVKPQFTQLNDQSAVWHGGQFSHLHSHLIRKALYLKTFS